MDNPSFSIELGRKLTFGGSGDARVTAVRESLVTIDTKGIRRNDSYALPQQAQRWIISG